LSEADGHLCPRLNKQRDTLRENLALAFGIAAKELVDREMEADSLSSTRNILELPRISTTDSIRWIPTKRTACRYPL